MFEFTCFLWGLCAGVLLVCRLDRRKLARAEGTATGDDALARQAPIDGVSPRKGGINRLSRWAAFGGSIPRPAPPRFSKAP